MSTIRESDLEAHPARPLRVRSVVGLAYDEIRSLIVDGSLVPGSRLAQGELADRLGISRGSVREALRRLAGRRARRLRGQPRVLRGGNRARRRQTTARGAAGARARDRPARSRAPEGERSRADAGDDRGGGVGADVRRRARRKSGVPFRRRGGDPESGVHEAPRGAVDRGRRSPATRAAPPGGKVAGPRRRRAPRDPRGVRVG